MSEQREIPPEWRDAGRETIKVLSVARAIERRAYPDGDAPIGLLAALIVAMAINRVADRNMEGEH